MSAASQAAPRHFLNEITLGVAVYCHYPSAGCRIAKLSGRNQAVIQASNVQINFKYPIPADKSEGAIEGYHCWAEFFAGGRWVPVDISERWKNPTLADYYFGHNPANRFELTKGATWLSIRHQLVVGLTFLRIRCWR